MSDESDDPLGLGDLIGDVASRVGRTTDRDCDFCGSSEGSVAVDRDPGIPGWEADTIARCYRCYNDPSTYDVHPEDWDG